ncbi:MAG: late competence development ComFB family protein [Moorea sp. SIO2B7]|nr:late competence development ComFB family protein [Moorena sp. SIO2B7]
MSNIKGKQAEIYQNIMESLVVQEVARQINQLSSNLSKYLDPIEVTTYALNHLPPLYASSQKGKHKQKLRAEQKYKQQITVAVRQAIAAVQRDPLRVSIPLTKEKETNYQSAMIALRELQDLLEQRKLLNQRELSWENLVGVMKKILNELDNPKISQQRRNKLAAYFHEWTDSNYQL